jgi:hypothetical protein
MRHGDKGATWTKAVPVKDFATFVRAVVQEPPFIAKEVKHILFQF